MGPSIGYVDTGALTEGPPGGTITFGPGDGAPAALPEELALLSLAAAICAGVGSGINFHVSFVYFLGGYAPACSCGFGFKFWELLTLAR